MNPKLLLIFLITIIAGGNIQAQDSYIISGKIFDSTTNQVLAGASVKIKGTQVGTVTKEDGSFQIKTSQKLPITLLVTSIGFKQQEFYVDGTQSSLSLSLNTMNLMANQVVVTASRRSESILKSPVSIEKLDLKTIKESPAPSFYDALENVKGVQMTTLSLGYKVPNTRGFSGTTNSRFLQMVDGVDNISPGIGAPVANAVGPTELDIESVELIPGTASALYGLNAVNGIANLKTKSPYKYEGLSFYQKTGINHVDGKDHSPALYTESSIRYAKVIGRFAFKLNGSYSQGTDWIANNTHDQYFDAGNKTNAAFAANNPGADLINRYGDEYNSDMKTLTLGGKSYDISRTGYLEKELTDYAIKNLKFDGSLHYKLNDNTELSYVYRIGQVTNNYQRGNRVRLDGETIQQHALDLKSKSFSFKAYYTQENTGDNSFNFRPLAENIDLAFKKPTQWYNDFTNAFNKAIAGSANVTDALAFARSAADNGRYQPGTKSFDSVLNVIKHTNNWDTVGAQMLLKSAFVHFEGQYDFSQHIKWIQLLAGFNYRDYIVTPDGNNYVNPESFKEASLSNSDFNYYSFGGFIQATKSLFNEELKITGSVRVDKSQYFEPKVNPRISVVYSPTYNHNFRMSFQNGYRFPTLFEGFAFVNNGGVRRLGGLPVTSEHLGVFENSYINSSITSFKNAVNADRNNNGMDVNTAIKQEAYRLIKSNYTYIQPEHVNSFEVGYKGVWLSNKLFIDVDYYFTKYNNFIGQLDVTQPYKGTIGTTGGANDSTAFYAYNGGKQVSKFKMWTNSKSIVTNQGIDLGITYNFLKNFNVSSNVSYAALVSIESTDAFTPAFNTPKWITNLSIGNREIIKNTGFNLVWHSQSSFYWNSPLAQGNVPGYNTFDAQINHRIPALFSTVKIAATNIFNNHYYQYLGGPVIGGFYYCSVVVDLNLKPNER